MKIEFPSVELSTHAYERLQERFPDIAHNKSAATNHLRSIIKHSEYIGIVPDLEGNDSHMLVFNHDLVIHIAPDNKTVKTVYQAEKGNKQEIKFRDTIREIYKTELRKIHRSEMALRNKLEHASIKNEVEIAMLKYRKFKTKSQKVIEECESKIIKLQNELWEYRNKVKELQKTKRHVAYSLASDNF